MPQVKKNSKGVIVSGQGERMSSCSIKYGSQGSVIAKAATEQRFEEERGFVMQISGGKQF